MTILAGVFLGRGWEVAGVHSGVSSSETCVIFHLGKNVGYIRNVFKMVVFLRLGAVLASVSSVNLRNLNNR